LVDLLLARHGGPVADLRPRDLDWSDPGLYRSAQGVAVPHGALASVRRRLVREPGDEHLRFGAQRFGAHAPRTLTGDLGHEIITRIELTERDDGGHLLAGVSLLREVLAVSATATIRRLLASS
jgi:hypothetical protein